MGIYLNTKDNDIIFFFKKKKRNLVLLYVDDTVIFGTDADPFQKNLNVSFAYSQQWKLIINYCKTKVLIFGMRDTSYFDFQKTNKKLRYAMNLSI